MQSLTLEIFTDPFCPFAYSAEPSRWRLQWVFGDQLIWKQRMIVLSGYQGETSNLTPQKIAANKQRLAELYGMPINTQITGRTQTSILSCAAYVATLANLPEKADALLRALRLACMNNLELDTEYGVSAVAETVGINPEDLTGWMQSSATLDALTHDAEAARQPTELAVKAFGHKLSTTSAGRMRYSAPSYRFGFTDQLIAELPGFWPVQAYEAAIGNLAPDFIRNPEPESPQAVLAWAKTPLATQEIAVVCNSEPETIRKQLDADADITFTPMGQDGFWAFA